MKAGTWNVSDPKYNPNRRKYYHAPEVVQDHVKRLLKDDIQIYDAAVDEHFRQRDMHPDFAVQAKRYQQLKQDLLRGRLGVGSFDILDQCTRVHSDADWREVDLGLYSRAGSSSNILVDDGFLIQADRRRRRMSERERERQNER